MSMAEFVKTQRKRQHWTQKDLAFYGGVGLRFIRELEHGKTSLRIMPGVRNRCLVRSRHRRSRILRRN